MFAKKRIVLHDKQASICNFSFIKIEIFFYGYHILTLSVKIERFYPKK